MGLRSLFIIMAMFYSQDSLIALIFSVLLLGLGALCIFLKNIFLKNNEYFALSILLFSIIIVFISFASSIYFPIWHRDNKLLIYILPLLPIALVEYSNLEKKYIFNKLLFFIRSLVLLGLFKEMISYGSILNIEVIKNYEGILFFDTFSGTLILIACGLAISERLGGKFANKWN